MMKLLAFVLLLTLPYYVLSAETKCDVTSAGNEDVNAARKLDIDFDGDEDNVFKIESNSIDQTPTNRTQWTLEVDTSDEGEFDLHFVRTVKGSDNNMINQFWIRIEKIVEYVKGKVVNGTVVNNNANNWQYEPGVDTVGFEYELTEVKFKKHGPGPLGNYTFEGRSTDDVLIANLYVFTNLADVLINNTKLTITPSMFSLELLVNITRIDYYQYNDSRVALIGKIWSRDEVISTSNSNKEMSPSNCITFGPNQKSFGFFNWFNLLLVAGANQTSAGEPNYHVAPIWVAPVIKNNSETENKYDDTTPYDFSWSLQDIHTGLLSWRPFIGVKSYGETGTSISAAGSIYSFRFELSLISSILLFIFLF